MQITKQGKASYVIYINYMYVGAVYTFKEDIDQCGIMDTMGQVEKINLCF